MERRAQFQALEKRIGYTFTDPELLHESLFHPSYLQDHPEETRNNQRLEFLGDAVLDLILSEKLFHQFPGEREGTLTKYRAILANGLHLTKLAKRLGLHKFLLMSRAEIRNKGNERSSSLEDVFEALIGAIYLDSDLPTVRDCVLSWYGDIASILQGNQYSSNPKGQLQELVQPSYGNNALSYKISREEGKAHDRFFEVELFLNEEKIATGSGRTKKEAEEQAAVQALEHWTKVPKSV